MNIKQPTPCHIRGEHHEFGDGTTCCYCGMTRGQVERLESLFGPLNSSARYRIIEPPAPNEGGIVGLLLLALGAIVVVGGVLGLMLALTAGR